MRLMSYGRKTAALFAASAVIFSAFFLPTRTVANGEVPSLEDAQDFVEDETGWDIEWQTPKGLDARGGLIRGTTTVGEDTANLSITCVVTYPPLKIRCWVNFSIVQEPEA